MGKLLQFLFEHPVLLFVLAAWVFGGLGKVAKAAQRARAAPGRPGAPQRSAEEVAAEMRRILGMDGDDAAEADASPAAPPPRPAVSPQPLVRREVALPERPPAPLPSAEPRPLPIHVAPHVGEGIEQRQAPVSSRVGAAAGLGTLGGRVGGGPVRRRSSARLVDLTDLKRVLVMNEILGPPLALRGPAKRA